MEHADIIQFIAKSNKLTLHEVQSILSDYKKFLLTLHSQKPTPTKFIPHPVLHRIYGKEYRNDIRIHIYGRAGSGKTCLATSFMIWYAYQGMKTLWIDFNYSDTSVFIHKQFRENIDYVFGSVTTDDMYYLVSEYKCIVIDDTNSMDREMRDNIHRIMKVASQFQCAVILISQVRKDVFGTKDLIPELGIAGTDITLNITRAEMVDNYEKYRYRHLVSVTSTRSKIETKRTSVELDYYGLDLANYILRYALETGLMYNRGPLIYQRMQPEDTKIGFISQVSKSKRVDYKWIEMIFEKIISGVSKLISEQTLPE